MNKLMANLLVALMFLQFNGPRRVHAQAETEIVGQIVRYDAISNTGTANADMIVRLKNGQFMRLLYSPHGYSFDAPPPKTDEMLPQEMFSNGREWKFLIHPPTNSGQRMRCTSFPKRGVRNGNGRLSLADPYDPVPGAESVIVPQADALPCQIISSWATIERVRQR